MFSNKSVPKYRITQTCTITQTTCEVYQNLASVNGPLFCIFLSKFSGILKKFASVFCVLFSKFSSQWVLRFGFMD